MSYIINKTDGTALLTLEDGTLDTSTSIGLVGRNYVGYGEIQNENFLFLLENFANQSPPARPIAGQTWFDKVNSKLNVYTGTVWSPVGAATVDVEQPESVIGSFWLNPDTNQLFVFTDTGWTLIGPEAAAGFDTTKAQARVVKDVDGVSHAVIVFLVNGVAIAVCSSDAFTLSESTPIPGFLNLIVGITLSSISQISGNLAGNATTATRFETARTINGIVFDGQQDITITSKTSNALIRGSYLTGNNFDGSAQVTWSVDGTPNNIIGKVVVRDSAGNFAAQEITAAKFIGPLNGNVTILQGTSTFDKIVCNNLEGPEFSGNAASANKLNPGRTINGVLFDGTSNIVVTAEAGTLTGSRLATNVTESYLNVVGTLNSLNILPPGVTVGNSNKVSLHTNNDLPTLEELNGRGLNFVIRDVGRTNDKSTLRFVPSATALSLGASNAPALLPDTNEVFDLGAPTYKFGNIHAKLFHGLATSAQYADLAENYVADGKYSEGTVLDFGGKYEVTLSKSDSARVAGIVSTAPAYLMNSACSGKNVVSLALQGRVPCKVIGPIRKGDMLVSAGDGYAKASANPKIGTVIGKSLEDFDGNSGVIEVAVSRF